MKKKALVVLVIVILTFIFTVPVLARAGGGGSSGGSSGGSGGSSMSHHSDSSRSVRSNPLGSLFQLIFFVAVTSGGSIVFIKKARMAQRRSRRTMAVFAEIGENWNADEIQRQVEESYFQIQECWRRMDVSYGAPYLSKELQKDFDSKIQWMQIRNEEVVQENVKLLSAMPIAVIDEEGEEKDTIWYLIHGKMTGYYIDKSTRLIVRGKKRPEAFYEYWKFVYRNRRWVLSEIKQKDEVDIDSFG